MMSSKNWAEVPSLVLIAGILMGLPAIGRAQILFGPSATAAVGGAGPRGVVATDVDGDRFDDLVVANAGSGTVSWLRLSSGTWMVAGTVPVGMTPRGLAVADLDGDGDQDVVVANSGSSDITILRNDGGGLAIAAVIPCGPDPRRPAVGDLDGDGLLDLVVAIHGASSGTTVERLMGLGALQFANPVPTSLPMGSAGPVEVTLGDWDWDGDLDVAAGASSGTVAWFYNDGTGALSPGGASATGSTLTTGIASADMDGDGDLDLVASSFLPPNVAVYLNDGTGSFLAPAMFTLGVHLQAVDLADFDVDGDRDLVTCDVASNTTRFGVNDGAGNIAGGPAFPAGSAVSDVALGDFDGNFLTDVATLGFGSDDVTVLTNTVPGPVLGACGAGTVALNNVPLDVLMVNGSAGGPARRVTVSGGGTATVSVTLPTGLTGVRPFGIWAMVGAANSQSVTAVPLPGAGSTCLRPYHLFPADPDTLVLTNNLFADPAAIFPSTPAPWVDLIPVPLGPLTLTLQGLIEIDPGVFRATNGVVVVVP